MSAVVAVAAALANYYKFGERSLSLYQTSEALRHENNSFLEDKEPYSNYPPNGWQAYHLLFERTDTIIEQQELHSFSFSELPLEGHSKNKNDISNLKSN